MSLHVIETGEVVEEMTRVEAERITSRIADKLDSIADNLEQVLPLIGEALTRKAWEALEYDSPTDYVSDRFATALTRLPRDIRKPIVMELSAAGMSTRAIAPIVGAKSHMTVSNDLNAVGVQKCTPETESSSLTDDPGQVTKLTGANSVTDPGDKVREALANSALPKSENIIGMDGKEYKRPEPKPGPGPSEPKRPPLPEQIFNAIYDLGKVIDRLERLTNDDRFSRAKEQVALKHESDLKRHQDALQSIISKLTS